MSDVHADDDLMTPQEVCRELRISIPAFHRKASPVKRALEAMGARVEMGPQKILYKRRAVLQLKTNGLPETRRKRP